MAVAVADSKVFEEAQTVNSEDVASGEVKNFDPFAGTPVSGTTEPSKAQNEPVNPNEIPGSEPLDSAVVEAILQGTPPQGEAPVSDEAPTLSSEAQPVEPKGVGKRLAELNAQLETERQAARQREEALIRRQSEIEQRTLQMQQMFLQQQAELARRAEEREALRQLREEEAGLSDVDKAKKRFEDGIVSKAEAKLRKEFGAKEASLKNQLDKVTQHLQMRAKKEADAARFAEIANEISGSVKNVLLKDFDPEDTAALSSETEEFLHMYGAGFGKLPKDSLPAMQKYLDRYFQARLKKIAKAGKKIADSRSVPTPLPAGRSGASQATSMGWPSLEELNANGISSHPRWLALNRPTLRRKVG